MNVLLVEPGYPTHYPPLGLLKIGRFHRDRGHRVRFVRGRSEEAASFGWDRIYVACVFTYHWNEVVRTLRFYAPHTVKQPEEALFVGGVLATLMADDLRKAVPCRPVSGTIRSARLLGLDDDTDVDSLLPDYDLIREYASSYVVARAALATATRGCSNRCPFCTVSRIEPDCREHIPIGEQVHDLERSLGPRRDLLMLDNNVLASRFLPRIVMDIAELGFFAGATWPQGRRRVPRRVDFTQGFETTFAAAPENRHLIDLLALLPVHPVRIAFDAWNERDDYRKALEAFAERGFRTFETFLLYDFRDTPAELYRRISFASRIAERLGATLSLHPIRYIAPGQKSRRARRGNAWNGKTLAMVRRMASGAIRTRSAIEERFGATEEAFLHSLETRPEK